MSRHTEIPPSARFYAPNHPSVRGSYALGEQLEHDIDDLDVPVFDGEPAHRKQVGSFTADGVFIRRQEPKQHGADYAFYLTVAAIILIFGLGAGYCLS